MFRGWKDGERRRNDHRRREAGACGATDHLKITDGDTSEALARTRERLGEGRWDARDGGAVGLPVGKKSWTKVRLMVEKCKLSGNLWTGGGPDDEGRGGRRAPRWPTVGG
jgi:hypothetical protein